MDDRTTSNDERTASSSSRLPGLVVVPISQLVSDETSTIIKPTGAIP